MIYIPLVYLKDRILKISSIHEKELINNLNNWGLEVEILGNSDDKYLSFSSFYNRNDLNYLDYLVEEIEKVISCSDHNSPNFFYKRLTEFKEENFVRNLSITPSFSKIKKNDVFFLSFLFIKKKIWNTSFKKNNEIYSLIKKILFKNKVEIFNNIFDILNFLILETGQKFQIFNSIDEKNINLERYEDLEKINLEIDDNNAFYLSFEKNDTFLPFSKFDNSNIFFEFEDIEELSKKDCFLSCFLLNKNYLPNNENSEKTNLISCSGILYRFSSLLNNISEFDFEKEKLPFLSCGKLEEDCFFRDEVQICLNYINRKIGFDFNTSDIEGLLKKMSFFWRRVDNYFYIKIPFYRSDLKHPEDILEEILKVFEIEDIENDDDKNFVFNDYSEELKELDEKEKILIFDEKKVSLLLSHYGWNEIITYSLINSKEFDVFNLRNKNFFKIINPKNKMHEYYRNSMIFSHLKIIDYNLSRGNNNLFFFEISFLSDDDSINNNDINSLTKKTNNRYLFLSATGRIFQGPSSILNNKFLDLFWMKGVLENIFDCLNVTNFSFSPSSINFLDSGIDVFFDKKKIGFLGILKKDICKDYDNLTEDVFVLQINLSLLKIKKNLFIENVSPYPSSYRDISFIFPVERKINYRNVLDRIKEISASFNILRDIEIFDLYQNNEMKKKFVESVSFRLVFQDVSRTLENKEIDIFLKKIIYEIEKDFFAIVR